MDDISEPLSIPPWIWAAAVLVAVGALVVFILKYREDDGTSDPSFPGRSRRRHRHRHGRSRRRDRHGNEYK